MGIFRKKDDDLIKSSILQSQVDHSGALKEVIQIMANDGVNICAEACACCWDTKIPQKYAERAEYIAKRTRIGHGSVTEHSNHVFYMEISNEEVEEIEALAETLAASKYLHTVYRASKKYNKGYLIIGGSWRAYRDLLLRVENIETNPIMVRLMSMIYKTINSAGMADLIKKEKIENNFEDSDNGNSVMYAKATHVELPNLEIVNIDDMDVLLDNIKGICPEPELFTIYDLLDMCTVTILFKNMSRIITQQLTRHRNAITQESQRYVDYSNGCFNSPAIFKPEKYDPNYKYSIQFGTSTQKMTLQELGDNLCKIYGQLTDKDKTQGHEMLKEDARAYLPNNVRCNKIYITMTWRNLFSFLVLREDKAAQAEIRSYAVNIGSWFRELYPNYIGFEHVINGYRGEGGPFFESLEGSAVTVDEVISEEEIISQMEQYAEKSVEGEPFLPAND